MIQTNELKRGNKVSYYKPLIDKPVIDTVIGVLPVEEYGGVDCAYLQNYSPVNIDALIPIPLTPEILESCGFEKQPDDDYTFCLRITGKESGYFDFVISQDFEIWDIVLYSEDGEFQLNSVSYLHQLQNLYFALTGGEELKISLNVAATK